MKIIAYYVLHYGQEWLYWSLRSIARSVDEVLIVYTGRPSFGHGTDIPNPDSKQSLWDIANIAANKHKIHLLWDDAPTTFAWEGLHRDYAVNICKERGADIILVVDADEIWDKSVLDQSISLVSEMQEAVYRIGMTHFWRSMYYACDDPAMPVRFIKPSGQLEGYLPGKVYHMGYAQSSALIRYKMAIHGHHAEIKPGWFENTFMRWSLGNQFGDVHPTNGSNFWSPRDVTDVERKTLEPIIGDHPYWNMGIIP